MLLFGNGFKKKKHQSKYKRDAAMFDRIANQKHQIAYKFQIIIPKPVCFCH
jgi:hypothetical protein